MFLFTLDNGKTTRSKYKRIFIFSIDNLKVSETSILAKNKVTHANIFASL